MSASPTTGATTLLLFDGRCGLCNRLVRFVLAHDRRDRFAFAPLQSEIAREILARHGRDARDLDTFCAVERRGAPDERLRVKGRAGLFVLRELGFPWSVAIVFGVLPTRLLDLVYDWIARNRLRWFGTTEGCLVPTDRDRAKFLTLGLEDQP